MKKNINNNININVKIVVVIVSILTVLTIRVSYASIFSVKTISSLQQIATGTLSVTFDGAGMQVEDMYPKATSDLPTTANATGITGDYMTLTITNNGTLDSSYTGSIGFDTTNLPSGKTSSDLVSVNYLTIGVYDVTEGTWVKFGNQYYTSLGGLTATENMYEIIKGVISKKVGNTGTVRQYRVYVWLDENTPTSQIGKLVYMKLDLNSKVFESLASRIISSSGTLTGITQYTGKVTDKYTAYGNNAPDATRIYFLTSNDNNNVKFAGFCWKIIRTTETGGVKLLYNGLPNSTTGYCDATGDNTEIGKSRFNASNNDSPASVGYMYNKTRVDGSLNNMLYDEGVNRDDSTIKAYIENWYEDTFVANGVDTLVNKLESAVFCNERSLNNASYWTNLIETYDETVGIRFKEYTLSNSLQCSNLNDSFAYDNLNAKTKYKVGMMTNTEANKMEINARLSGSWYFLISPNDFNVTYGYSRVRAISAEGGLNDRGIGNTGGGVRPVISINSSVGFISGVGSVSDPFIVD